MAGGWSPGLLPLRRALGLWKRPHYMYCVYHAGILARRLGYPEISVVEFGVAGGAGLLLLERYARTVEASVGVGIRVYGFDTGKGLPEPIDYRDLPYHWRSEFFTMDRTRLEAELADATLVIGDVASTVPDFWQSHRAPPLGAALFDMDYYSSTRTALQLLSSDDPHGERRLPRVFCYLDDIIGTEVELYNDFTGVRLAISEFNREVSGTKISPAYHLLCRGFVRRWYHQIYVLHDFAHPLYNAFISDENQQLPL